jgi:hypothetical protein
MASFKIPPDPDFFYLLRGQLQAHVRPRGLQSRLQLRVGGVGDRHAREQIRKQPAEAGAAEEGIGWSGGLLADGLWQNALLCGARRHHSLTFSLDPRTGCCPQT